MNTKQTLFINSLLKNIIKLKENNVSRNKLNKKINNHKKKLLNSNFFGNKDSTEIIQFFNYAANKYIHKNNNKKFLLLTSI